MQSGPLDRTSVLSTLILFEEVGRKQPWLTMQRWVLVDFPADTC